MRVSLNGLQRSREACLSEAANRSKPRAFGLTSWARVSDGTSQTGSKSALGSRQPALPSTRRAASGRSRAP
jgi:hypothetical protein